MSRSRGGEEQKPWKEEETKKRKRERKGGDRKRKRRNQKGKIEACRSLDLDEGSSTADGTTRDCDSGGETIGRVVTPRNIP